MYDRMTVSDCGVLTAHTHQKPDITPTNFSTVQVTDIFQRLVSKYTLQT